MGPGALQAVIPASGMFSAWLLVVSARGREECQGRGSGSPRPPSTLPWGLPPAPHGLGADEPAHRAPTCPREPGLGAGVQRPAPRSQDADGCKRQLALCQLEKSPPPRPSHPGAGGPTPLPTSIREQRVHVSARLFLTPGGGTVGIVPAPGKFRPKHLLAPGGWASGCLSVAHPLWCCIGPRPE